MLNKKQKLGEQGEAIAVGHLKKAGYKIIETNYRTKLGEIDIIAKDKDTIVFVEVKARSSVHFGSPKWAVTPKKQKKNINRGPCLFKVHQSRHRQGQVRRGHRTFKPGQTAD
jgi:putative endonuclease